MIETDKNRPFHLIINPHSGYGSHRHMLTDLRAQFRLANIPLSEYTTRGPADATNFAKQISQQTAGVIVWGGDGTVNEVANALAGTDVPILPCRAGTENLLAKELRIPSDPAGIVETLGQINPLLQNFFSTLFRFMSVLRL